MFCIPLDQKLYESIRSEPFKIPEDDGNDLTHTFFNPDREGWLLKLGNKQINTFLSSLLERCLTDLNGHATKWLKEMIMYFCRKNLFMHSLELI